jgi:hypothetical protein
MKFGCNIFEFIKLYCILKCDINFEIITLALDGIIMLNFFDFSIL